MTNKTEGEGEGLLPCPFCASTRLVARRYYVECPSCGVIGPNSCLDVNDPHINEVEAIELWNTRSQTKGANNE